MSRRSQNRNQYESDSVGEFSAGAFTLTVVSTAGLIINQDMYLVVEPDVPGQREWIKVESITGNQLNIQNPGGRNLTGSDGDLTHPTGSKVRSVPTQQIFEDIFADAEDDELALTQHETDGGDPHAQAGYLRQGDTDPLYVNVSGDSMNPLAQIKVDTNPSDVDDLSRKGYVDDILTAHTAIEGAHHVEYTDSDAVDALAANDTSKIISAGYSILPTDQIIFVTDTGGGSARVLVLPDASDNAFQSVLVTIQAKSGGGLTREISVEPSGSDQMFWLGVLVGSVTLVDAGDSMSVVSNGIGWYTISNDGDSTAP